MVMKRYYIPLPTELIHIKAINKKHALLILKLTYPDYLLVSSALNYDEDFWYNLESLKQDFNLKYPN